VVTGANRGIGREARRQLAVLAYTVLRTARPEQATAEAAQTVGAEHLRLDVTDPARSRRQPTAKDTISLDLGSG
jgi:NAD(P)-dependent dehydrogenase (short-subunit alcohol dehydrogenase family)